MLYETLTYLKQKLELFFFDGKKKSEPLIMLSAPWSNNVNNDKNGNAPFLNSISLINIEEEKIFKTNTQQIIPQKNGTYLKKQPDLKINLYLLISSYNKNYEDSLKFISRVIGFFQRKNVFEGDDLPPAIEKLIIDLYSTNFDEQNQVWTSLSAGYLPSVIYKVRMLMVDGEPIDTAEYKLIHEIDTNVS